VPPGHTTARILDVLDEPGHMAGTLGHDQPILTKMSAQGIDRLCPLPDQDITCPKHNRIGLCHLALLTVMKRIVGRGAAS
jgi:hypothetical protein